MKTVVGISLGEGAQDFAFETRFLGKRLSVRRIGTNHSVEEAERLLAHWQDRADAIGLGVAKEEYAAAGQRFETKESRRLVEAVTRIPVTTGGRLTDILQEWAVRHVQGKLGHYFTNARVLFFSGTADYKLAQAMAEFTPNLEFADALFQLGIPKMLTSMEALELYASGAHYVTDRVPEALTDNLLAREWRHLILRRAMQDATVVVAPVHELDAFGLEELAGKTIVTSTVNDLRVAAFKARACASSWTARRSSSATPSRRASSTR